ncbi:TPA_asm: coat protein [ssRNA phage SRR5208570_5]|uniref:Coat protein n=1 Tax=ssRNA phage SRR5208570_5 TaxID=2786382 RepID=A0A8S5KYA9_9VIRU|nr:coat protein [ssRNA phage SRR5208570_5]DAD50766.1 TPA_asm: coat protein [ssRNA phage SRR5208570_5]
MAMPSINTKTFTYDSAPSADSAKYVGVNQTATAKDTIQVRRVAPKATKTDPGVARSFHKRVITEVINGLPRDLIAETSYSIPVGASAANITALRVDNASFATSTSGVSLVDKATLNY